VAAPGALHRRSSTSRGTEDGRHLALSYWAWARSRAATTTARARCRTSRSVELDHKFPDAQLALGDCLTQLHKFDEAVGALNPGLNWGSKVEAAVPGRARQRRDGARLAARRRHLLHQAREAAPDDPVTKPRARRFLPQARHRSLAIPEYEKAVELDSTDIDLRFALGRALAFDTRYEDAIQQLQVGREDEPGLLRCAARAR